MGVSLPSRGEARGKLLLLGEHSAVYGFPAIGVALPWRVSVVHTPGPAWKFPGLGPYEPAVRRLVDWFVEEAASQGHPLPVPGRLEFTTEVPVASGFGSSGALCASLVNLFFPSLSLGDRDRFAWRAEGLFHGNPSGIDTALALRDGWWALDPSTRPVSARPLAPRSLVLLVGAVVRESDTKTLVAELATRRQAGDPAVDSNLGALGQLAVEAIAGWNARPLRALAEQLNQAREHLRGLGLESPALTRALDAGLGCSGALAAKLSGAGGGGAFFVLFEDATAAYAAVPLVHQAVPDGLWACPPLVIRYDQGAGIPSGSGLGG